MDARLFLQFVALILLSDVRRVKMQHNALKEPDGSRDNGGYGDD
jgi:hypothetical protein